MNEPHVPDEIAQFVAECPSCYSLCMTNMKETEIPFFKSVVLISSVCTLCGFKSNEVKSGAGISKTGIKYTLKLTGPYDLTRDILKSDIAYLEIPEIDFSMESGTLGGKFTTLEGILRDSHQQLSSFCCSTNDTSTLSEDGKKMRDFLNKLESVFTGNYLNITIIIDDPSGNSYLQNLYAPDVDPNLTVEHYERNGDQNDLLGLNEIKTENYT